MNKRKDMSIRELQEVNYLCSRAMCKILDATINGTIQLEKQEADALGLLLIESVTYTSRREKREKYKEKK